ncbi:MAG: chromosome segregation protein SMC [Sphingorhabdus sp.]
MRLKRLKLTGFKSFVEPTELRIENGLTGIVGPNGCGKSNLLEAIRWVMGESSPKSMRSGGMEDVIFAGTASRPQREFAEVSLLAERGAPDSAPGFIANDDDHEIEVTRRIERGAGSAYRANGRDVRAKDVALIFADAATGAHSPALVSQGRIGAIIAAKPQERRQMLEEAAGISGLHVRRKDAEQKLRAASTNLDRLDTILGDMAVRSGQLKRQARQAERYKRLTAEIGQAEARLIYVRWKEAKSAADSAKAEAEAASAAVEQAASLQKKLSDSQQAATAKLAGDRAAAMAARDASSDLAGRIIKLTGERGRILERIADLKAQAQRIADDGAREDRLTHDAAEALERLEAENARLAEAIKLSEETRPALSRAADNGEKSLRENELALARAHAQQAKAEAEQRVAKAALAQAETRLERTEREAERLAQEKGALGDRAELTDAKLQADTARQRLEKQSSEAAAHLAEIETQRTSLLAARNEAQTELAQARAQHAALLSEQGALEKALSQNNQSKAIDHIRVDSGYERALAAALGDDADAAIGGDQGRRWASSDTGINASATRIDGDRLSDHVTAPGELALRLSMIAVAQSDDGRPLAPGERLVTLNGEMRRWDGFVSEDDGAVHAEMLARANRLRELPALLAPSADAASKAEARLTGIGGDIAGLQHRQSEAEQARQQADGELRQALREVDRTADALERLRSASDALKTRLTQSAEDIKAANTELNQAQKVAGDLPDAAVNDALVGKLGDEGEALKQALMRAQADLSAHGQKLGQEKERRAVAQADIRSWRDRAGEAEKRISEMKKREAAIAEERSQIKGRPAILSLEIEKLDEEKAGLSQRLAALQAAESASEDALRILETQLAEAAETLSTAREARAGAEARAENQESRRIEMGRISSERFECPPPLLPEKLEFADGNISDAASESARLDKLQSSRERIGPVNLIAADELAELEEEQAKNAHESEELNQAINQLRGSIGALNREGRQRLLEAFEAVDLHFRRLFATLFDGGQAHLALIDSDDPLEAGLEIYAQPPGKKLQSLTLLSGGEQALTAVALIFALFLTNPAPICVLDEVDAPLDDANIERFCDLLDAMTRETDTRYLIVTHNAVTMSRMHRLFGVTMIEQGISRLVSVDLGAAEELLAAE